MNKHNSRNKIVYLGVQPTPYTQYLLERLRQSDRFDIDIYFTYQVISDLPWKSKMVHETDRFFNRRFLGIDPDIVKLAWTDKTSMFYVLGYNEPTKFLVLLIRMLMGYPYSYFNDSIKLNRNFYHLIKRAVLPVLLSRARAIFTTGNFGVRRFRKSGYAPRNATFVDFPFFVPLPELPEREPKQQLTFLCSGRLVDRKGFDDVIRAFTICQREHEAAFRLLIAGAGPNEAQLRGLVAEGGLEDKVTFLGWLEAEQLKEIMLTSDVFVHYVPIHDPFPVAVLEAMAFGLPIVGSDRAGSVADRVKNGVSGYVLPARQPGVLAENLMRFIRNPAQAVQMGREARKTAEEWPVERADRILDEYLFEEPAAAQYVA
jgi:glycosyltransferase involved in cell wall biosynthesis